MYTIQLWCYTISEVDPGGYSMSPAFLLLQYYDFHSSHSSYKNARVCMNYAEGLHLVPFISNRVAT